MVRLKQEPERARRVRQSPSWAVLSALLCVATGAFALSCGDDRHPPIVGSSDPNRPPSSDSCANSVEGCGCATEGATIACGETESSSGEQVVCIEGSRSCVGGRWSACVAERRLKKYAPAGGSGLQALAAAPASCADPCNPSCSVFADTPVGIDAGAGFTIDDGALTLPSEAGGGACSNIVITPGAPTLTVTQLEPSLVTSPPRLSFSATCGVNGPAIVPTWTLDPADADTARIDPDGVLTVQAAVAKTVQVTASSASGTASVPVVVRVEVSTVEPACEAAVAAFDAAPTGGTDPGHTLYPYAVPARPVVFPLGLTAPLVQWATGGTAASCVKVSLRFPAGSANPSFLWSAIVSGSSGRDPTHGTVDRTQPAAQLAQTAWSSFDRTSKGNSGEILLQRRRSAAPNAVMAPMVIPVRFANDALRGTVYYTRYTRRLRDTNDSPTSNVCSGARNGQQPDIDIGAAAFVTSAANGCLGGNCAAPGPICPVGTCTQASEPGASLVQALDLSRPGAAPVDPFADAGTAGCPVCHSVSADGSTFVANTFSAAGVPTIASIGSFNGAPAFTPLADAPAYSWVANRDELRGAPQNEQSWGFGYAAISPDGSHVLAGPNFWGSTTYDVRLGNGNRQDAGYGAGGKRYFLFDLRSFRGNVTLATRAPLPSHAASSTALAANGDGRLYVDGMEVVANDLLLIKNEPLASRNGVYLVVDAGSASRPWVLSREDSADEPGELAFGQKLLVEFGDVNAGKYFQVAGPSTGAFMPGATPVEFGVYTTVMAATAAALPAYGVSLGADNVRVLTGSGELPESVLDGMTPVSGMTVLVRGEAGGQARYNGVYTLQAGPPWRLERHYAAAESAAVQPHWRVRVNQGVQHGGRTFVLATVGPITLDQTPLVFELDPALDEGTKLDDGGTATTLPTMMYPVFSPDGGSLAYVNGDRDAIGGSETGWRRGLSLLSFDRSNTATPFSNKRRLLNTYSSAAPGMVMKWPFFEPDSRGLVFVESAPDEFCPLEAYGGVCSGAGCASRAGEVAIDTDIERACFQASNAMGHGNGAPTHRGYWPGRLNSVSTESAAQAELAWLNDGLASQGPSFAADAGKAYQPTVLPFTAGGYRWVIFTSTRAYGNQMNAQGTHFTCAASLLWVAALDDASAGAEDRSYPAFLLPGQSIRSITDPRSSRHYINERGYLVPSPCKQASDVCTVNEECCGGSGAAPTSECRLDPDADPPERRCAPVTACVRQGDSCAVASDCCGNVPCVQGVCAAQSTHRPGVFNRVFTGSCPSGYFVRWGNFEWHADASSSSTIDFSAQIATSSDFSGARLVSLGQAQADNVNPPGDPAESVDVGVALATAGVATGPYLNISMAFRPSTDGTVSPVLYDWNQRYDCIAAE